MKKINSIKILPVESYESLEEFEKIYKHFFNPLVNFINGYLSNRENSEEVVQNVFLRFWENKNQLNITGPVKSYLFQSAKNAMIDFTRRNKKYDHNESLVTGDHKNF
ncbi:MAG: sigma factor, partial [Saprospiraceae bacterium]